MGINRLNDPAAVRAAMREYDVVGRAYFLEKYGFGKSRDYMLSDPDSGRLYDSKAIVGAAFAYAFPGEGPLRGRILRRRGNRGAAPGRAWV